MNREKLFVLIHSKTILTILSAIIGGIIFIGIYGTQVLNPLNIDWLLDGGDLSQHYLGWAFFRESVWTFPVGVASNLAYPHGLALTFMDSIPLIAIPLKLFVAVLPEHFQYFGWWGLISFMTMGVIISSIIQRWTKNILIILLITIFFCLSPLVLQRMFMHTALAGQWIILLGVYAVVYAKTWTIKRSTILWSVILSLSVLIHPYFIPMNVFLLGTALVIRYRNVLNLVVEGMLPLISAYIVLWFIGGFTVKNVGQQSLQAGYDLASPLLPLPNGWSAFTWSKAVVDGESFGYIGLGGLILVIVSILLVSIHISKIKKIIIEQRQKTVIIAMLLIILIVFALGTTIKFMDVQIFHYHIPHTIEKIWAIFRVTARLIWPLYYLGLVAGFFILIRLVKNKVLLQLIIAVICLAQAVDILGSLQVQARHDRFESVQNVHFINNMNDKDWQTISANRKHVIYLDDLYGNKFENVSLFCIKYHLTLNTGYFARSPKEDIASVINDARKNLKNGTIPADTIYISDRPYEVSINLHKQTLNDFIVTVK
jgi:hypothetical protein